MVTNDFNVNGISVIIPCYNVEKFVARCLDSLLKQDILIQYELLVINDGSIDNTQIILNDYFNLFPNKIRIINKKNEGLSSARNVGILNSHYPLISFIDSDDYVEPNYLSKLYYTLVENNADVAMCGIDRPLSDGRIAHFPSGFSSDFVSQDIVSIIERSSLVAWNKLFKRRLFDDMLFPERMNYEDMVTIPQVLYKAKTIAYTNDVLYHYCVNHYSIIGQSARAANPNIPKAMDLLENTDLPTSVLRNIYIRRMFMSFAISSLLYEKHGVENVQKLVIHYKLKYGNQEIPSIENIALFYRSILFLILNNKISFAKLILQVRERLICIVKKILR